MGDYKFCLKLKFLKSFTFTNFGKKNTLKTYKCHYNMFARYWTQDVEDDAWTKS